MGAGQVGEDGQNVLKLVEVGHRAEDDIATILLQDTKGRHVLDQAETLGPVIRSLVQVMLLCCCFSSIKEINKFLFKQRLFYCLQSMVVRVHGVNSARCFILWRASTADILNPYINSGRN